jgi:hypothetical protein
MRLVTIAMLVFVAACDPGWHYKVAGATAVQADGRRFDLPIAHGLALRVYSSVFTAHLQFELDVRNEEREPISVDPSALRVRDTRGVALPISPAYGPPRILGDESVKSETLTTGETLRIHADFAVDPRSRDLKTLTVDCDGIKRAGKAVPVRITLERG